MSVIGCESLRILARACDKIKLAIWGWALSASLHIFSYGLLHTSMGGGDIVIKARVIDIAADDVRGNILTLYTDRVRRHKSESWMRVQAMTDSIQHTADDSN